MTVSLFFGLILVLPSANAASSPAKAADSAHPKKQELPCRQLQDKIKNKQDVRQLVKTNIEMGYDACEVINCSIKGGGELPLVICGALEAGTSKDDVSRCCVDAGADAREVAAILSNISEMGLCDVLPERPSAIAPPPSGGHGTFLSPSGF